MRRKIKPENPGDPVRAPRTSGAPAKYLWLSGSIAKTILNPGPFYALIFIVYINN